MTDQQPEALRLADALVKHLGGNTATQAAAELRRLYEVNEGLVEALQMAAQYTVLLDDFTRAAIRDALVVARGDNND